MLKGMYAKYMHVITSMPLTRAKKFPHCMLIHDKQLGAPATLLYILGAESAWLPNFHF